MSSNFENGGNHSFGNLPYEDDIVIEDLRENQSSVSDKKIHLA